MRVPSGMGITEDLERRMAEAAEAGDFETAAVLRDAIARIQTGDTSLREQIPGRMGLGSSQERYVTARTPPRITFDPMTIGHRPASRRSKT